MSYPEITEYEGYLIYKHDPAYQAYSYQGYDKSGNPVSMLCETKAHAEQQIRARKASASGGQWG